MGTDSKGHDVGAQLIYGLRVSLFMGLSVTFFSMIISILVGALQGYLGGFTDLLGQRFLLKFGLACLRHLYSFFYPPSWVALSYPYFW